MIPLLYFLLFAIVVGLIAFGLTLRGMSGPWENAGAATVGRRLRSRNRLFAFAVLAVVVVLAVLEGLIPDVSDAVQDLQYFVGDAVGAEPALVYTTGNGTVSWGLYLAVLAGTLGGLLGGTLGAIRRYPVLNGLTLRSLL